MKKLTDNEIDGILASIQEAIDDNNHLAADTLCLLAITRFLADIDVKFSSDSNPPLMQTV